MLATLVVALLLARAHAAATPPAADQECLACHGEAGMKSDAGKSISIDPAKHAVSAHSALTCKDCHTSIKDIPHSGKIARVKCATCHADEAKIFAASAHSALGETACASCHGDVHEVASAEKLMPAKCSSCHGDEVKQFSAPRKGQGGEMLLVLGEKAETTQVIRIVPTPLDYWVCTTFPRERRYRSWFLEKNRGRLQLESYEELARKFPQGLAGLRELPEELSGAVLKAIQSEKEIEAGDRGR